MEKLKEVKTNIIDSIKTKGVIVLLSTYNGERYLRTLIDSVLAQKNVRVYLLIRDDGSKDGTPEIIREYALKFDNVNANLGQNVGVVESFNTLIQDPLVDEFEYIAFCDQDDYWCPDKMRKAIDSFEDDTNPQLYCSNLMVVNESLQPLHEFYNCNPKPSLYTTLVQNCAPGCVQVFNRSAASLYRKGIHYRMEMHDYWMFLVCQCFGNVKFDMGANILYRQHEDNVVGNKKKTIKVALNNIDCSGKRKGMIIDFLNVYSDKLSHKQITILSPLVNYDKSVLDKLKLLFNPRYHGYSWKVTIGFKLRVVLGKVY